MAVASEAPPRKAAAAKAKQWRAVRDAATGRTYYYNRKTRETSWDRPAGVPREDASGGGGKESQEGKWRTNATWDRPSSSPTKPARGAAPEGDKENRENNGNWRPNAPARQWRAARDPATGKLYYYRRGTQEVRWERPDGFEDAQKERKQAGKLLADDSVSSAVASPKYADESASVATYDEIMGANSLDASDGGSVARATKNAPSTALARLAKKASKPLTSLPVNRVLSRDDTTVHTEVSNAQPKQLEASGDRPTLLFQYLQHKAWTVALKRVQTDPHEAAVWIASGPGKKNPWRVLPLHAAVILGAPTDLLYALVEANSNGAKEKDLNGSLPIHLAACSVGTYATAEGAFKILLRAHPESRGIRDAKGHTPVEILQHTRAALSEKAQSAMVTKSSVRRGKTARLGIIAERPREEESPSQRKDDEVTALVPFPEHAVSPSELRRTGSGQMHGSLAVPDRTLAQNLSDIYCSSLSEPPSPLASLAATLSEESLPCEYGAVAVEGFKGASETVASKVDVDEVPPQRLASTSTESMRNPETDPDAMSKGSAHSLVRTKSLLEGLKDRFGLKKSKSMVDKSEEDSLSMPDVAHAHSFPFENTRGRVKKRGEEHLSPLSQRALKKARSMCDESDSGAREAGDLRQSDDVKHRVAKRGEDHLGLMHGRPLKKARSLCDESNALSQDVGHAHSFPRDVKQAARALRPLNPLKRGDDRLDQMSTLSGSNRSGSSNSNDFSEHEKSGSSGSSATVVSSSGPSSVMSMTAEVITAPPCPKTVSTLSESWHELSPSDQLSLQDVDSPTVLYLYLHQRDWASALHRLSDHKDEASVWVWRKARGYMLWRFLPLHAAIVLGAPSWFVLELMNAYPNACRKRDMNGSLPIHLAATRFASGGSDGERIVNHLRRAFPDSLHIPDGAGQMAKTMIQKVGGAVNVEEDFDDVPEDDFMLGCPSKEERPVTIESRFTASNEEVEQGLGFDHMKSGHVHVTTK